MHDTSRPGLGNRGDWTDVGANGRDAPTPLVSANDGKAARRITSFAQLRALLREDRAANDSRSTPGYQALAVYRFGVWACDLETRFWMRVFRRIYLTVYWFVRSFHGIELPASVRVGRRLRIGHQGGIVFHPDAAIGDDCLIRHNVTIGAISHSRSLEVPVIGDRVEIGAGAVIIGSITVGDDALIGANVVVRSDVPPGAVVIPPEPKIVMPRARAKAIA
jgi:serine O-acetyltransferase